MKEVQAALKATGIPTFALAWRSTAQYPTAPDSYIVYTTMTTETEHWDDAPRRYLIYVYLNIWCKGDPTEARISVRNAMRAAGFALVEESDSYEEDTQSYLVSSTWLTQKEVDADGA